MIKEIKYNGYTSVPSDYECQDGNLAISLNLYPGKTSAICPVCQPVLKLKLSSSQSVRCIHEVSSGFNYIIFDSATLSILWLDSSLVTTDSCLPSVPPVVLFSLQQGGQLYSVTPMGNTLVILTSSGMYYLLWKGNEVGYSYLGQHIPELPIRFGLNSFDVSERISVQLPEPKFFGRWTHQGNILGDANKEAMTSQVLAAVNKFIAENSIEKGRFIFPFFVRYALRLFDGSLTMHSAPVLMLTSTGNSPEAHWDNIPSDAVAYSGGPVTIFAHTHALAFSVVSQDFIDAIKKWGDIVKSVDIFVSAPIYTYDQNGTIELFAVSRPGIPYSVGRLSKNVVTGGPTAVDPYYRKNPIEPDLFNDFVDIPYRDDSDIAFDIKSCAHFYLVKSIAIDRLSTAMTELDIDKGILSSLTAREVMTDDYDSHHTNHPKIAFVYNRRLNIADIRRSYFRGYHPLSVFCYCNSMSYSGISSSSGSWGSTSGNRGQNSSSDSSLMPSGTSRTVAASEVMAYICVYIMHENSEICVSSFSTLFDADTPVRYFYYPDTKACKATIILESSSGKTCYEIKLQPHDFLNGAYYYGTGDLKETTFEAPADMSALHFVPIHNKLYTSEVNNPFYFPLLGISTIGTGSIIGLATAAKALSQGQFGQFPLYAFTSEGVWALEVSTTGSFSVRQPITRDVCINPDGITQIDSAVLFPTDRGIMLLSGSTAACISEEINSEYPFDLSTLPQIDSLAKIAGFSASNLVVRPFSLFLQNSAMLYDYVGQRIILYNPGVGYAYVYSLLSKRWGMMMSSISSSVNAYPKAYAMDSTGQLLDYSSSGTTSAMLPQIIVSRPLKLDNPDIFKTVNTIIQRGNFRRGHVRSVLYGSRDLTTWHLIWSSNDHYLKGFSGTPYKYFRILLLCGLSSVNDISGATVSFIPRLTNQLR